MQALFLLLVFALGGADVYRWVDGDGQVHYSDRPTPGAERIAIDVRRPPATGQDTAEGGTSGGQGAGSDTPPAAPPGYQSLTITSPAQEQVLWNIEGQLDVAAAVQPPLLDGHALRFYLDGRMTEPEPGEMTARFQEVFRGEHSLRVEVVDPSGRVLVSSPTTRFYVRQTTIANQAPAPLPAVRP